MRLAYSYVLKPNESDLPRASTAVSTLYVLKIYSLLTGCMKSTLKSLSPCPAKLANL